MIALKSILASKLFKTAGGAMVKFRAILSALGIGGTAAVILALAIWGPPISVPFTNWTVWQGGYAPRLSVSIKERDDAITAREAALKTATVCEQRREREADACEQSLTGLDTRLRERLERCESRIDRIDTALTPRQGDPDAPPICLPRRLVPLERLLGDGG